MPVLAACSTGGGTGPTPRQAQTVVLVSLDGFRWDYLDRPEAAGLRAIAASGVRARQMEPVFPTMTFPNHYTLVTGLWFEHHGIVGNTMEDAASAGSSSPTAWRSGPQAGGAANRSGSPPKNRAGARPRCSGPAPRPRSAGCGPPGTSATTIDVPHDVRVRKVLQWLALPRDSAPALITTYFSAVDGAGHRNGPDAPETNAAIARVDSAVTSLWRGIQASGPTRHVST